MNSIRIFHHPFQLKCFLLFCPAIPLLFLGLLRSQFHRVLEKLGVLANQFAILNSSPSPLLPPCSTRKVYTYREFYITSFLSVAYGLRAQNVRGQDGGRGSVWRVACFIQFTAVIPLCLHVLTLVYYLP